MLQNLNLYKFINKQLKSFSIITFTVTFILIYKKSPYNIIPLNIIVLLGSIILFHCYPNYYKIIKEKNKELTPLLIIFDIILHYMPLIYIINYKLYDKTETNYKLCLIILILYFILLNSEIFDIYFNYNQYFNN